MIRTIVVDDDFRVAKVHAASVNHVEGFTVVGEAHTCSDAATMVRDLQPDLLLLDLYLPDGHGLDLMRSLAGMQLSPRPDFVVITAARDVASVRAAIQLGALYYLVKPFGHSQLREQLIAYRQLHDGLEETAVANQDTVDSLYGLMRGPAARRTERSKLPPTMTRVLATVRDAPEAVSATGVSDRLGVSRATAQRYLAELERRGLVELVLSYGQTGRPEHSYRLKRQ